MPHYYFHVLDDLDTIDDEGIELPDEAAARERALSAARVLMCESLTRYGRITLHHRIDIEDSHHRPLASVSFSEAVEIVP